MQHPGALPHRTALRHSEYRLTPQFWSEYERQPHPTIAVEMTRSQTPAKPAMSDRNIEICQWVMPGNDVLISSVESGLAEASRPR